MRKLMFLLLMRVAASAEARASDNIIDISPEYQAAAAFDTSGEFDTRALITIEDKRSHINLFALSAEFPNYRLRNGFAPEIEYRDFNFDGIKDLAIETGQSGCYDFSRYDIYLGSTSGFQKSDAFSDLTRQYCGMFEVNRETQTLTTYIRDTNCCGSTYVFTIKDGIPFEMENRSFGLTGLYMLENVNRWNGNSMVNSRSSKLYDATVDRLLSFRLKESGGEVLLFKGKNAEGISVRTNTLNFALIDAQGNVTMAFPADHLVEHEIEALNPSAQSPAEGAFNLSAFADGLTLSFENRAHYVMREAVSGVMSLDITADGYTTHYTETGGTAKGSLKSLLGLKLSNLQQVPNRN